MYGVARYVFDAVPTIQRGCLFYLTGWLMLALIGLAVGLVVSFIEVCWLWLDSIRIGYCPDNIFLNQATCCGVPVITGGSSQSGSAINPYNINGDTDAGSTYGLGSYDCRYFQTWAQVYDTWAGTSSSSSDGTLSPGYWVACGVYVASSCTLAGLGTWLVLTFAHYARCTVPQTR